jgi:energy-coupling factor transport system permease protein
LRRRLDGVVRSGGADPRGAGAGISAAPAAGLLAALAVAALLATHTLSVAAICLVLLAAAWRAPARRRWPYLIGTLATGVTVFVLTPFVEVIGSHPLWTGPTIPVVGRLDVTTEELRNGLFQGLRLVAVGLAFAVYALLLDHDRLLAAAGWARRSTLAAALATRLVPVLERDARDLRLALRGRGVELGPVRLLSPLLAGSLERGLNLAEAMEARGYGRAGRTRAPLPPWRPLDRLAFVAAVAVVVVGALWL